MGTTSAERPAGWVRDLAQDHLPDVVSHVGLCKPNAPGRSACSSLEAFEQRQVLKAAGRYRAERVIVAATPLEIVALELSVRGRIRHIDRWDRWTTPVVYTPRRGPAPEGARAFMIGDPRRYDAVELVPIDPYSAEGLLALIEPPAIRAAGRTR